MKKRIARFFYHLSIFFDYRYSQYIENSQKYHEVSRDLYQETIPITDIIIQWNNGNLQERLPIYCTPLGAMSDTLNFLRDIINEEITKLPPDHFLRHKFQIYEIFSPSKNIVNPDLGDNDFDFDDFDIESDINLQQYPQEQNQQIITNSKIIISKTLANLFYYISIYFDKKYSQYLENNQKYHNHIDNLSQQIIAILDVVETWPRGDLRSRIEINDIYKDELENMAYTLNLFIDNLTENIKKLPSDSSLRKKFHLS
jgi:hypothetical protein